MNSLLPELLSSSEREFFPCRILSTPPFPAIGIPELWLGTFAVDKCEERHDFRPYGLRNIGIYKEKLDICGIYLLKKDICEIVSYRIYFFAYFPTLSQSRLAVAEAGDS